MRCHWIKDAELGRIHIPGCWGGALEGPHSCTCGRAGSRRELENEVDALKERVRKLEREKIGLSSKAPTETLK